MRLLATAVAMMMLIACGPTAGPVPPKPRDPTPVAAPFAKTWNAVIDEFAARNTRLLTLDRTSGYAATATLEIARASAITYADCGVAIGVQLVADHVTYTVVVRGDSARSTIRTAAQFTKGSDRDLIECSSSGFWEHAFEARIKQRAEGAP